MIPSRGSRSLVLTPKLMGNDGISAVARLCCAALASAGDSVSVCSLGDFPQNFRDGIPMSAAAGSKVRFTAAAMAQYWNCPQLAFCLHLHLAPVALAALPFGCRLAIFLHGVEAWQPLTGLRAALIRRATSILANSQFTADRFRACNPAWREVPIHVCPLAVENIATSPCHSSTPGRFSSPSRSSSNYALIVGRMQREERYKGHDQLLEIWPEIVRCYPGLKLAIIGEGDDRARIRSKSESLGLGRTVEFHGNVGDSELLHLYSGCRFFVMPSSGEGFGLVFLEAMRAGKACIAGRGAAEEVVQDGITGRVVDPNDPEQLRRAIHQFLADPGACDAMGVAGRRRFLETFTPQHFAQRFLDTLGRSPLDKVACVA